MYKRQTLGNLNDLSWVHARELTKEFPKPMNLEPEKIMFMILLGKKAYAYIRADQEGVYDTSDEGLVTVQGMLPKRRDNCKWTKDLYMACMMARYRDATPLAIYDIIARECRRLMRGEVAKEDLVVSGSVQADDYTSDTAQMAVFAAECREAGREIHGLSLIHI